ncbi:hypothetical protein [Streptomyces sp. IB201691-2A2]|uniref:hypothetical protein n=1 Tax=Streptomyces sp. IB201691-2A2 TaxID=2561920 RepID=UPI00117D26C4|nr:hypothetical protein [Streptomyces sp. IB201691-2A2]TRO69448.1 hypothetical protein E4K73_01980 [Streptomyces sp. IB201691-2A2]
MSGVRWQWQDGGSGSGHMRLVADSGTFSAVRQAYAALLEHGTTCEVCRKGACDEADSLYRAWRDMGGPWTP